MKPFNVTPEIMAQLTMEERQDLVFHVSKFIDDSGYRDYLDILELCVDQIEILSLVSTDEELSDKYGRAISYIRGFVLGYLVCLGFDKEGKRIDRYGNIISRK